MQKQIADTTEEEVEEKNDCLTLFADDNKTTNLGLMIQL